MFVSGVKVVTWIVFSRKVISTVSVIELQSPFPFVSNTSLTDPAEVSAVLGKYCVTNDELAANEPEPSVVHCPPVARTTLPSRSVVGILAQMV